MCLCQRSRPGLARDLPETLLLQPSRLSRRSHPGHPCSNASRHTERSARPGWPERSEPLAKLLTLPAQLFDQTPVAVVLQVGAALGLEHPRGPSPVLVGTAAQLPPPRLASWQKKSSRLSPIFRIFRMAEKRRIVTPEPDCDLHARDLFARRA